MTLITRRDVLFGLGGGIAGAMLTPVPWTLLDDVAIWTQHRRALPVPRNGETTVRATACTLCPAGCGLRVRAVSGRPVFLAGEGAHPLGGGACPFGLTLHHLAHHPLRLTNPVRLGADGVATRIALGAAVAAVAGAIRQAERDGRSVLVVDARPGRVISRVARELAAAVPGGVYAVVDGEGATLDALAAGSSLRPLGIDLERTGTLLSFGAPVLEGWGRPGRLLAVRDRLRVVQLDTRRSLTASLADEWLAIRPGSEGPLALALAQAVVSQGLVAAPAPRVRDLLQSFAPARVAGVWGLESSTIEALARSLVSQGPAVAVGGGDPGGGPLPPDAERAIALLDVVLGSVGRPGGIVARREVPEEGAPPAPGSSLRDVPDGQAGLLILDGSESGRALPWPALERKLAPGALVVSLSPFRSGLAAHADIVVPAPAPLEGYDEVLPTADAAVGSYAIAAPILPAPEGATDPCAFLHQVVAAAGLALSSAGSHPERMQRRAATLHASGRGRLIVRSDEGFREESAADTEAFWQALAGGGCWIDDARPEPPAAEVPLPSPASVERWLHPAGAGADLPLVAFGARGGCGGVPASPVLSKLYQETDLRPPVSVVALNPDSARARGLVEGRVVWLLSAAGAVRARLACDPTLPPERVALAAGPQPSRLRATEPAQGALALSVVDADLGWRGTHVSIREA